MKQAHREKGDSSPSPVGEEEEGLPYIPMKKQKVEERV